MVNKKQRAVRETSKNILYIRASTFFFYSNAFREGDARESRPVKNVNCIIFAFAPSPNLNINFTLKVLYAHYDNPASEIPSGELQNLKLLYTSSIIETLAYILLVSSTQSLA